jgi:hypothetical protein
MSTPIVHRRKKPVPVDTIQWLGDNEADVQAFTGGSGYFYALDPEDRENSDDPEATATVFDRLHSTWVLVYTGQHIVRGVKGEFYPIAEDVLAETYETADTPLHAACRTEFLTEAADVAASCVALYEGSDEAAAAAGAMEGLADRFRRMAGEAAPAAGEPEFFQPGHVYAREHHGRTIEFHVRFVDTASGCDFPTAFGFRKDPEIDVMLPMDADDFYGCGWTDVTEAGDRRG